MPDSGVTPFKIGGIERSKERAQGRRYGTTKSLPPRGGARRRERSALDEMVQRNATSHLHFFKKVVLALGFRVLDPLPVTLAPRMRGRTDPPGRGLEAQHLRTSKLEKQTRFSSKTCETSN